jgi:transposase
MSKKEYTRIEVIQLLEEKRLKQRAAAEMLGVNERHVRRLLRAYRLEGERGLISKRRGKPSNNQLDEQVKQGAVDKIWIDSWV